MRPRPYGQRARANAAADAGTAPFSSIPPNFSHYTLNPNPRPNVLGWAKERIEEKLGRGVSALRTGEGRLPRLAAAERTTPPTVAFNVYRSTAGGAAVRLNAEPITEDDRLP